MVLHLRGCMPCCWQRRCRRSCWGAEICMQDPAADLVWQRSSRASRAHPCHSAVSSPQRLQAGTETRQERESKQAEMEALGADPDIYDKLTASVAPSIWQMDDVKKGILCQLFGGSSKVWTAQQAERTWAAAI